MNKLQIYKPGTKVYLGDDKDIKGTIVAIYIRQTGVAYEVAYWNEKQRVVEIVDETEITTIESKTKVIQVGFNLEN